MSRSRFHDRDRFYLYMHGLIFEINTSVQAGSTRSLRECANFAHFTPPAALNIGRCPATRRCGPPRLFILSDRARRRASDWSVLRAGDRRNGPCFWGLGAGRGEAFPPARSPCEHSLRWEFARTTTNPLGADSVAAGPLRGEPPNSISQCGAPPLPSWPLLLLYWPSPSVTLDRLTYICQRAEELPCQLVTTNGGKWDAEWGD